MCETSKTRDLLITIGKTGITAEQAHKGLSSGFKRLNELTFNSKTMYLLGRAEMKRINDVISVQMQ